VMPTTTAVALHSPRRRGRFEESVPVIRGMLHPVHTLREHARGTDSVRARLNRAR
jgi:hypothetical protein